MPLIYLIAGEQSGDVLGARLIRAIRRRDPDATFAGIGGETMAREGFTSLFPLRDLALMGLLEVLPRLRQLKARMAQTVADIELAVAQPWQVHAAGLTAARSRNRP